MYDEQVLDDILFLMIYAGVTVICVIASCYLLFRRGNAFAPDITTPSRPRRWTAIFFAFMALSHLWYLPTQFVNSLDEIREIYLIGGLIDSMTVLPLAIVVLLSLLQDRQRPLWPIAVMEAPLVMGLAWCIVSNNALLLSLVYAYFLLLGVALIIYMAIVVRQYRHWLRDNYADLEHKEVWQSFVVAAIVLLVFGVYVVGIEGPAYKYVIQLNDMVLVCYLLWRVETLSDLSLPSDTAVYPKNAGNIALLLQQHCIDTQLYLQHDLTITQLAKDIGTNRLYLSQYLSSLGTTYNAYISDLRIRHFIALYRMSVATQRPFTAQQLASESGYRSYSTFSLAFKQRMGQSVTAWMRHPAK